MAIARLLLDAQQYRFSTAPSRPLRSTSHCVAMPANARSIHNAIDRARLRQANRLFARMAEALTRDDLITIEARTSGDGVCRPGEGITRLRPERDQPGHGYAHQHGGRAMALQQPEPQDQPGEVSAAPR